MKAMSTAITSKSYDLFTKLIKNEKTLCGSFDPHNRASWEYLLEELQPLFDKDYFKDQTPVIVIISMTQKEKRHLPLVVEWEESRKWALEHGAFHQEVDEWSWEGLEHAYGFGFWSFLYNRSGFQKECPEALIYRKM